MLLKLLGLPVSLPAAGIRFCLQQVADMAEAELNDETVIREQLLLLQVQLEEREIDEEEYAANEAVLFQRLREIRAERERLAQDQPPEAVGDGSQVRRVVIESPFDNPDQP